MGAEIPDTGNAGAMRRAAYTERPCTYERDDKQGMRLFLQGKTQQAVWQDFPHRGKGYGIRREQAAGTGQGGIPHDSEPLQPPHIRGGRTCRTVRHGLFADAAQVQNILRHGAIGVAGLLFQILTKINARFLFGIHISYCLMGKTEYRTFNLPVIRSYLN